MLDSLRIACFCGKHGGSESSDSPAKASNWQNRVHFCDLYPVLVTALRPLMLLNVTVDEADEVIEKRALNDSEIHRHWSVASGH